MLLDVNGIVKATTAKLSNLTAGYLSYQTANGLANSNMYTDGAKVGIKTTTPEYDLDVNGDTLIRGKNYIGNASNYISNNVGYLS